MLTVVRDKQGSLAAACDWWLVDEQGNWNPHGVYVYLNRLESNPEINLHRVRRVLVRDIGSLAPHAVGVYWEPRVRPGLRSFRRTQLSQLRQEVMV